MQNYRSVSILSQVTSALDRSSHVPNTSKGDKICLFGFSRGAYTARALAGMLYKVLAIAKVYA
jgi:uncharacterized protein (DUF2235 family)